MPLQDRLTEVLTDRQRAKWTEQSGRQTEKVSKKGVHGHDVFLREKFEQEGLAATYAAIPTRPRPVDNDGNDTFIKIHRISEQYIHESMTIAVIKRP